MRRFGVQGAYEQLKEVTRGKTVTAEALHGLIRSLEIPEAEKERLLAMTPAQLRGQGRRTREASLMALKSTIFKATLAVADIDHNYYADHALTLARHPSETDERMMMRLVALALNAHKLQDVCNGDGMLAFGAGLSNPDEPDVWLRDFTGRRCSSGSRSASRRTSRVIKACGKADEVIVYCFNHAAEIWWRGIENKLTRLQNLQVCRVPTSASQAVAALAQRIDAAAGDDPGRHADAGRRQPNSIDIELLAAASKPFVSGGRHHRAAPPALLEAAFDQFAAAAHASGVAAGAAGRAAAAWPARTGRRPRSISPAGIGPAATGRPLRRGTRAAPRPRRRLRAAHAPTASRSPGWGAWARRRMAAPCSAARRDRASAPRPAGAAGWASRARSA